MRTEIPTETPGQQRMLEMLDALHECIASGESPLAMVIAMATPVDKDKMQAVRERYEEQNDTLEKIASVWASDVEVRHED